MFFSAEFDHFFKHNGIKIKKTTSYTPHQNGVAKQMNRTLMERARTMLSGADLEKEILGRNNCYCMLLD